MVKLYLNGMDGVVTRMIKQKSCGAAMWEATQVIRAQNGKIPKFYVYFLLRHVMLPLLFGSLEVCRSYRFKAHLVDCKQLLHNPQ